MTWSERPQEMPAAHAYLLRRRLNSKLVRGAADVMSELPTQGAKSKRRGRFCKLSGSGWVVSLLEADTESLGCQEGGHLL